MSKLYRRFNKFEISTIVAWFILSFTFIPFFALCVYNVPIGDDFWFADSFRRNGVVETQILWYKEWAGRYMATFLISTVNPVAYGNLGLGFLHPLVIFLATIFSLKFLIDTAINYFNLAISKILSLSVLLFFYVNYLPDVGETFYWMAGAYTYQVAIIFLFLYIGLLIKFFSAESSAKVVVNMFLAFLCLFVILGTNEIIVLYVCCLNALIAASLIFTDKRKFLRFLPLLLITIALSCIMIFAEGNFARASLFERPPYHLLKTAIHSVSRGIFVLFFWIPTFTLLLLCLPGISKIRISSPLISYIDNKKKSAIVIFAVSLLVLVAFIGFFPSIYATRWIPQRAYTPIFVVFMIVFALVFIVLMRYFPVLTRINEQLSVYSKTSGLLLCILVLALSHNSNVMNAYVDLTSGKAASYHDQVTATYTILETVPQDTVFVKEIKKRPLILPIRWPAKHNRLINTTWQEYFDIKRVELD